MIAARSLLLAGALTALPALSGCVAAAIPVIAAGGVFKSRTYRHTVKAGATGQPQVWVDPDRPAAAAGEAAPGTLVRNYNLDDGTRIEVMAGPFDNPAASAGPQALPAVGLTTANVELLSPGPDAPATKPAIAAGGIPLSYTIEDGTHVRVLSGGLPAPAGQADPAGYDALYDFADQQGQLPIAGSERRSAILAHPLDLLPETQECSIHPAALLIDLDPAGATIDPAVAVHADPAFAGKLAALRADGIAIGWISGNTADRAGAVRRALVASGLDPAGRDELALLRYPEERKQTRRADFAKEFCLVAIAGDDRSDFDELYQYIKVPLLAAPLDALLGNGWFLIPQPLT